MEKIPYPNPGYSKEDIEYIQGNFFLIRERVIKLHKRELKARIHFSNQKNLKGIKRSKDRQINKLVEYFWYGFVPNDEDIKNIFFGNLAYDMNHCLDK
jgi:hypothetical protein